MQHKGFRQKEEAIFEAYFEAEYKSIELTPTTLARAAGISRSTFYRHHRSVYRIRPDYEWFMLKKYKKFMRDAGKTATVRQSLRQLLLFVIQNRRRFYVLIRNGGEKLICGMVGYLHNELVRECGFPNTGQTILNMYASEVCELIREWGESDFAVERIGQMEADLLYLAKAAPRHLGPIDHSGL